jgi:hypothetical protein
MLVQCLEASTKATQATLDYKGALSVSNFDFVCAILDVRNTIADMADGTIGTGIQTDTFEVMMSAKAPRGQDPAIFIATFNAWRSKMSTTAPWMTERGYAAALLRAFRDNGWLYQELIKPGYMPKDGYPNVISECPEECSSIASFCHPRSRRRHLVPPRIESGNEDGWVLPARGLRRHHSLKSVCLYAHADRPVGHVSDCV